MTPDMILKLKLFLEDWISEQFTEDMQYFYEKFSEDFLWFSGLNEDRKIALIALAAFIGYKNLCGLSNLIFALEAEDFEEATFEMISEKLVQLTKGQSAKLANVIATGICYT
jgi:hypothetical protein